MLHRLAMLSKRLCVVDGGRIVEDVGVPCAEMQSPRMKRSM